MAFFSMLAGMGIMWVVASLTYLSVFAVSAVTLLGLGRTVNRALSRARPSVERRVARLKSWRVSRRARCSPNRMSSIAAAVLTLERQR